MPIRESNLSWTNYRKAAKNLKTKTPGITPQQIIGRLGYPTKNGQRIFITSDGEGGVKQRNRTAQQAREAQRQKRRRIQTGKLSPEEAAESRSLKDEFRQGGFEADHNIEIGFLGRQLEDLERRGGNVQQALDILKGAGYSLGDMPGNLQRLSQKDNILKRDQLAELQKYLGSREALGQSPSARRPDLIVTGTDLPPLGGFQTQERGLTSTGGSIRFNPQPLEGFVMDQSPITELPPTPKEDLTQQVFQTVETGVKTAVGMSLVPIRGAMVLAGSYLLK